MGRGDDSGGESDDALQQSRALRQQKKLCDDAMELVNAGVALQNATPPNLPAAEEKLGRAVTMMEQALAIEYPTQEERDASQRLNNKMNRYVKMIRSQREKGTTSGPGGQKVVKYNILELDKLPPMYNPIVELLNNSSAIGNIFDSLKQTFGFQEANVENQREHVLLQLTNFKEQSDEPAKGAEPAHPDQRRDPQQELELANKGIKRFHSRIFANYTKWCKYISTKPAFTSDPLVDIVLFFLIWGEAGNFRQVPECLCFIFHTMLPQASSRGGGDKQPGDFLAEVIRPMYNEVKKDNDKKTAKGARAPHAEIRNYDDFNEFFWNKKCLKYNTTSITEAFAEVDKKGKPKTVKKSFTEVRSWTRALLSFRRIFLFNCALFCAVLGFSLNVVMFCPDTSILYGADVTTNNATREFVVFGKNFTASASLEFNETASDEDGSASGPGDEDSKPKCVRPMLAGCLGMNFIEGETFSKTPIDFKSVLLQVPFTNCVQQSSGRCGCYIDLLTECFSKTGFTEEIDSDNPAVRKTKRYDQSLCVPDWRVNVEKIIKKPGPGRLNCEICQLDVKSLIKNGKVGDLISGLLTIGKNDVITEDQFTKGDAANDKTIEIRQDMGALAMMGGGAMVALVFVCEIFNKLFSGIGSGYVGRSLPVPIRAWCRYTCFWLLLFLVKLTFDYQFMVKGLVETSLFIWYAREDAYLPYSNFMVQMTFHNIAYILFLWIPAFMVFMYDAQIFYSLLSVVFGSFAGFNLRIGELRSFRVLRLSFKSIPRMFNKKIVPNIQESGADGKKKPKKKKAKKGEKEEVAMPVRHFERVSMADGIKPLTVKAQMYSNLLEQHGDLYSEVKTPNGEDDDASSASGRNSVIGSADVISDRELNVLSYLIDSVGAEDRKLYPPAFLTAGKLDESLDIITECAAVYEKLSSDKKKKDKTLQKIETTMRERLLKDDLRVESILGSYKFSSQVVRYLLGDEHKDLNECFEFMEEMASQQSVLKGLNLKTLHQCRAACAELMKALLEVPKGTGDNSIKFQRSLYKVIDSVEAVINCMKKILSKQENLVQLLNDTPLKQNSFFFPGGAQTYANVQLQRLVNSEAALDIVSRAYQLLTVDNFDAEPRSEEGRRRLRFFANSLYRGQTLARTVRGMMYHEDAIRFLHWLEICENEVMHQAGCPCNKCKRLDEMVALKFNYVCTCQIYGKQKDEQRQQASDLEYLLRKHPSLRVAYVDGPKKMKDGPPKYYSVLIRSQADTIAEVYRVELPGDPVIGEGKPENQNHAIIFSRGELLQCIDMNQDAYLEECLKVPNLLSTMDRHNEKCPLTIIGFREHVFTGGVSNLASFMSIQELSFVSLGQRMLAIFHVRQHYGHPDIFDKLFAMGTGGTAKASRGVNLSEDIFAGFNTTLRGGRVSHEEFVQVGKGRDVGMQQLAQFEAKLSSGAGECVTSRDALRMATRLDFFRLHSWFYGNLGWYFTQTMTVVGVYFFIYGKVYMAL
ncbi:hypothetical protein PybrP1_002953, partial [[Pythium] brassicae (nom. inval.)]